MYLDFLIRPGSWSGSICYNSIVLPYCSLSVISFNIMDGAIVFVACLGRCLFVTGPAISSLCLLG